MAPYHRMPASHCHLRCLKQSPLRGSGWIWIRTFQSIGVIIFRIYLLEAGLGRRGQSAFYGLLGLGNTVLPPFLGITASARKRPDATAIIYLKGRFLSIILRTALHCRATDIIAIVEVKSTAAIIFAVSSLDYYLPLLVLVH